MAASEVEAGEESSSSSEHEEEESSSQICIMPPRPGTAPKSFKELYIPRQQLAPVTLPIEEAQRWMTLVAKTNRVYRFPLPTILPKVLQTRYVSKGEIPKDVAVDRRRRQYSKMNIVEELKKAGIGDDMLQPTEEQYNLMSEFSFKHKFPLSFFDDSNFDINSPEAWFELGVVGDDHYPLPARAYLPFQRSLCKCHWTMAAVTSYNPKTGLWTLISLEDEITYEVPKLQFMFLAEDPHKYVRRLKAAIRERHKGEQLMLMELIVDCVLHADIESTTFQSYKPIEEILEKSNVSEQFKRRLRSEVNIVFERLMALYELEQFIIQMPKEFPQFKDISLKEFLPTVTHVGDWEEERRQIQSLHLDIKQCRYGWLHASLFYCLGGIETMMGVATECQHVETWSVFVCSFNKPTALADFLYAQESHSDTIATNLKVYWPQKLVSVITLVLRALGKGWLDISLHKWTIYEMSKISRFLLQVKFRMQECIEVLLLKSLVNFSKLVCEPCLQFLELKYSYKWTSNFIETEFPCVKPVFAMTIGISEESGVFYSTNPDDFQPGLMDIFKRGLEKTAGVRIIDADVMTNLKFAPNRFILTVELIEDTFLEHNQLIKNCYAKAVLPIKAYAQLYERFIHFYLLDLKDFMAKYADAKKPSAEVKRDILEYKRQKEEIREILPAYITIGPFYINVDTMKQFMIKKYINLVRLIFEYYVDRMFDINEQLLDNCQEVFNKIAMRPMSIEHLYQIRDYGLTVPDIVEEIRSEIQVMWLEYELLDSFFYNLSDHQFSMKWKAFAWPHLILVRLSTLKEEQKIDMEDFLRMHYSECQNFEERLESLNDEVQAYSLVFNANRAQETSVDIKKTWAVITELDNLAKTLQYRQELFELEPLSMEFLNSIIESFKPYKQLWYACANFLKLEDATCGNPIAQIEMDDAWTTLMALQNDLLESLEIFREKAEIIEVAKAYLAKIQQFIPVYNSIQDLRNENWMHLHWMELAHVIGSEVKYSIAMNYQYLIRKGILRFLPQVHEISSRATEEADAIRLAIEEEERKKQAELESIILRKQLRRCRRDIL